MTLDRRCDSDKPVFPARRSFPGCFAQVAVTRIVVLFLI